MPAITPFLWFNDNAEEAINLYVSVFPNSRILNITRYGDAMPAMKGKVLTAVFELDGKQFRAIDGGPQFPFTEAISFQVDCEDQAEVDRLWDKLGEGGKPGQCGWLKDKFGLSWQIIPKGMGKLFNNQEPEKAKRVTAAMMKMSKIELGVLQQAYDGK